MAAKWAPPLQGKESRGLRVRLGVVGTRVVGPLAMAGPSFDSSLEEGSASVFTVGFGGLDATPKADVAVLHSAEMPCIPSDFLQTASQRGAFTLAGWLREAICSDSRVQSSELCSPPVSRRAADLEAHGKLKGARLKLSVLWGEEQG